MALSCILDCWSIIYLISYMSLTKKITSVHYFCPLQSHRSDCVCAICIHVYLHSMHMCVSRLLSPSVFWDIVYHSTQSSSTGLDGLTSRLQGSCMSTCPILAHRRVHCIWLCVSTGRIWTQILTLAWQAIYQLSTQPTHSSDWLCDSLHTETQLFFKH